MSDPTNSLYLTIRETFVLRDGRTIRRYPRSPQQAHAKLRSDKIDWVEVTITVIYGAVTNTSSDITNEGTYDNLADAQGALSDFTEIELREYIGIA